MYNVIEQTCYNIYPKKTEGRAFLFTPAYILTYLPLQTYVLSFWTGPGRGWPHQGRSWYWSTSDTWSRWWLPVPTTLQIQSWESMEPAEAPKLQAWLHQVFFEVLIVKRLFIRGLVLHCKYCGENVGREDKLRSHLKNCMCPSQYSCSVCPEKFPSTKLLGEHKLENHKK